MASKRMNQHPLDVLKGLGVNIPPEAEEYARALCDAVVTKSEASKQSMNHGGARAGAGRKAQPLKRYNVMLTPEQYAQAKAIGNCNASAGLRVAIAEAVTARAISAPRSFA